MVQLIEIKRSQFGGKMISFLKVSCLRNLPSLLRLDEMSLHIAVHVMLSPSQD